MTTGPTAPPGWYPWPDGQVWWWDGARWAVPLPERPVDPSLAVLPHLGMVVMPVFAALALRLTLGRADAFVRHHATEALNAQIWFGIVWNGIGLPAYIWVMTARSADPGPFLAVWLVMAGVFLGTAVMSVVGAVQAYRRVWWRYPLIPYRFVRGAADRSSTR